MNQRFLLLAVFLTGCASPSLAAPSLPYCPGFQIVTAIGDANTDYVSIKTVETVDADGVAFRYSTER